MTTAPPPADAAWAVIFTSLRADVDREAYSAVSDELDRIVLDQPGYLGHHSFRDDHGVGVTISYWSDEASMTRWKELPVHAAARRKGRERWYEWFVVHVCRVERVSAKP